MGERVRSLAWSRALKKISEAIMRMVVIKIIITG